MAAKQKFRAETSSGISIPAHPALHKRCTRLSPQRLKLRWNNLYHWASACPAVLASLAVCTSKCYRLQLSDSIPSCSHSHTCPAFLHAGGVGPCTHVNPHYSCSTSPRILLLALVMPRVGERQEPAQQARKKVGMKRGGPEGSFLQMGWSSCPHAHPEPVLPNLLQKKTHMPTPETHLA